MATRFATSVTVWLSVLVIAPFLQLAKLFQMILSMWGRGWKIEPSTQPTFWKSNFKIIHFADFMVLKSGTIVFRNRLSEPLGLGSGYELLFTDLKI
jgi:hypothetical protein